jgi:hypothetical protein
LLFFIQTNIVQGIDGDVLKFKHIIMLIVAIIKMHVVLFGFKFGLILSLVFELINKQPMFQGCKVFVGGGGGGGMV